MCFVHRPRRTRSGTHVGYMVSTKPSRSALYQHYPRHVTTPRAILPSPTTIATPDPFQPFFFVPFCSYGCMVGNKTEFLWSRNLTDEAFQARPIINWDAIQWVKRPFELWIIQCGLALFALGESLLLTYIGYKVVFFFFYPFSELTRLVPLRRFLTMFYFNILRWYLN